MDGTQMELQTEQADEIEAVETVEIEVEGQDTVAGEDTQAAGDDFSITLGDEGDEAPDDNAAPAWVREVRKENRELKRKLAEKEAQDAAKRQSVELGPKPKLEDFDFDESRYDAAILDWNAKAQQVKARADAEAQERAALEEGFRKKQEGYQQQRANLSARAVDFEDAEAVVLESLNTVQQGILLQAADQPHLLVYALGKHPDKVKALAAIKDPVKLAAEVARMETKLKVTPRKPSAQPEQRVTGNGAPSQAANLDRLKAEAEKTGDWTAYFAAKKAK